MCCAKKRLAKLEAEVAELKAAVEQFRREVLEERIAQNSKRLAEAALPASRTTAADWDKQPTDAFSKRPAPRSDSGFYW